MVKHQILEQCFWIKSEPIAFQKGILFHGEKLLLILQNVIFNPFLFNFFMFHELRKERMRKGQGYNTVAKVVPLLVDLYKLRFFNLFKVHVAVFYDKYVLLLFFQRKLAKILISLTLYILFA